jgi:signal transduction histidine kinase
VSASKLCSGFAQVSGTWRVHVPWIVDITTRTRSGHTVFVVSNTGPMIPATDIDRLFQPLERYAPIRSSQGDGTAPGLSIVKAIADAHHATGTATPQPTIMK